MLHKSHVGEMFRYMVMTCTSAAISLGIPFVLHEGAGVRPSVAVAVGLLATFFVNFAVAKRYVFRRLGALKTQMFRFAFVSLNFRIGEYLSFLLLNFAFGIDYMIALIAVLIASLIAKFFIYKLFVFAHGEKTLKISTAASSSQSD